MSSASDAPKINPGDIVNWPILKLTYRTDPQKIAALLPPGIEPGQKPHVIVGLSANVGSSSGSLISSIMLFFSTRIHCGCGRSGPTYLRCGSLTLGSRFSAYFCAIHWSVSSVRKFFSPLCAIACATTSSLNTASYVVHG